MPSALLCAIILPGLVFANRTRIVFLGTGTPRLDPDRFGSAVAIVSHGKAYIVDCGPGVVRRTAAARSNGTEELSPANLTHLFVTHLHSDHTLGYPDLIFSPWVVGRKDPLEAYGPHGLADMTLHLLAAYRDDIEIRTNGLEHGNKTGYKVDVHEIVPGPIFHEDDVKVTAFLVKHGTLKEAYGYRFDLDGRGVVFSGDTCPCDSLVEAAQGADVLVQEAYEAAEANPENRPGGEQWRQYMQTFHTSAEQAGEIAAQCKVGMLVLTHVLRRHATDKQLIAEVRKGGYKGPIHVAKDLDTITFTESSRLGEYVRARR